MNHTALRIKKYILLFGDIAVFYLSLFFTLWVRYGALPSWVLWEQHVWPFTAIFVVWLVIFYVSDLYNLLLATSNVRFFVLSARALAINFLAGTAFFYLLPFFSIAPKRNLFIDIVITAVLFVVWRQLYNAFLKSWLPKQQIAFIGVNDQVRSLIKRFHDHPHLGFNIAFVLSDTPVAEQGLYGVPVYRDIENVQHHIKQHGIHTLVFAEDLQRAGVLRSHLFDALRLGVNFISLNHFYEKITGTVPVRSINKMWFLENLNEGDRIWYDRFKRIADIVGALLILVLTLPFWPLVALGMKWYSRGPLFYRQERIGKNFRRIHLIKFRTMTEEGNQRQPTMPNDPRISPFGNFLRRTRIDEIPQVINILRGEMSFIGPRPERPEIAKELTQHIPFYNERTLVVPGVTGWDQVCGEYHSPSVEDTLKKLQYDLFYIKNRSIFLDVTILLKTVRAVLMGYGR